MGCAIIGCGKALPALEISNDELTKLVDTSDEWIVPRTGIHNRRIAVEETGVDLGSGAARQALGWDEGGYAERRIDASEIDLVIYATISPDTMMPSNAALVRRRLGLENAVAFDLTAACSGFVYGTIAAESMMAASAAGVPGAARRNPIRHALVIGVERLSRITNWSERSTCVLFGDGGGAAVLEWDESRTGIMGSFMMNEDDDTNALNVPVVYDSPFPFDENGVSDERPCEDPAAMRIAQEIGAGESVASGDPRGSVRMNGQKVFKFSAEAMGRAVNAAVERAGVTLDDIALIVPHQANERIIKYAAKKMGLPMSKFQVSIADRGNASAACVPMTLSDAYEQGRIHRGDLVVLVGFGGGYTSGAVVYEA